MTKYFSVIIAEIHTNKNYQLTVMLRAASSQAISTSCSSALCLPELARSFTTPTTRTARTRLTASRTRARRRWPCWLCWLEVNRGPALTWTEWSDLWLCPGRGASTRAVFRPSSGSGWMTESWKQKQSVS